ncbi:MAG: tRNA lysidine(34) synthetase TilS [Paludibacter sp.]
MKMQQKVQNYIEKHKLLTPNGLVIVGVSGGADSIALLNILVSLGYDCVIAHCNFHLRMAESDRDEAFVRKIASDLKLPFYHIDFETSKYASEHNISIEMAARDLRYVWFYELLDNLKAQAIVVAHHADDSIETMLMNLVRGTGLRGLTGIANRNEKVVRPLLCCSRLEVENYLKSNYLLHIVDSSNAELNFQRNKFRNQVLPLLEEINPSVRHTLYESLDRFDGTLAIYEQALETIEKEVVDKKTETIRFNIDALKKQANIPTVLYELIHPYGFGNSTVKQISEQIDGESGKMFYSSSYQILKDREFLILNKIEDFNDKQYTIFDKEEFISEPIQLTINKFDISADFLVSKAKNKVHFDAEKLTFPLQLRRWQEGDSFYPFGMNQRKKVSDFFIDNKINRLEKEKSWLLISDNEIVWIIGYRTDNRFKVTEETKKLIEISVIPI